MASKACEICAVADAKYKCPTCRAPYCSLLCCKKHKETSCTRTTDKAAPSTAAASTANEAKPVPAPSAIPSNVDTTKLTTDQLEHLRACPSVLQKLQSPAFQNVLSKVYNSNDRVKELEKAMLDPSFSSFMYEALDEAQKHP